MSPHSRSALAVNKLPQIEKVSEKIRQQAIQLFYDDETPISSRQPIVSGRYAGSQCCILGYLIAKSHAQDDSMYNTVPTPGTAAMLLTEWSSWNAEWTQVVSQYDEFIGQFDNLEVTRTEAEIALGLADETATAVENPVENPLNFR